VFHPDPVMIAEQVRRYGRRVRTMYDFNCIWFSTNFS